jgi:hypothetical protein
MWHGWPSLRMLSHERRGLTALSGDVLKETTPTSHPSRRAFLAAAALLGTSTFGGEAPTLLPPDLEQMVDRGLFYLQRLHRKDGSYESNAPPITSAALAALAFMSAGNTPDLGRFGRTLRLTLDFILAQPSDNGYLGRDGSHLDGHAIAMLALTQAAGTEIDEAFRRRLRTVLEKGVGVITTAQNVRREDPGFAGGWRTEPASTDADLPVTGWCFAALLAAESAGLPTQRPALERAGEFVMRCYNPSRHAFAPQPEAEPTAAASAIAMLCLRGLDQHPDEVAAAAGFLVDNPLRDNAASFYASVFHTTRAALHAGEKCFTAVWRSNLGLLRGLQRRGDGSFPPRGPERDDRAAHMQPTALACLTLAAPLRILPLFQK